MATTPTRSRGSKDTAPQQQQQQRHKQPVSPSSSAKQRKALSRFNFPPPVPRRMAMDPGSSFSVSSASRSQQQKEQKQQEEDKAVSEEGAVGGRDVKEGDDADEIPTPGSLATPMTATTPVTETYDGDDEQSSDTTVAESPFLVFPSARVINVRRKEGYKESGLNCSTPTRPKHGDDWIGDLFSRGRLTRSRRTRDDALLELGHDNVAQRRLQDEDEEEEEDDEDDASRGGGAASPVTPRSQFGRWKYGLMMSQSTMKPPKLSQEEDDTVAVKRNVNGEDDGDGYGDSEDGDGDTDWPFRDEQVGSDPSTPKRRPSKIPRGHFMSPSTPTFQDSGCDDNDVEDEEENDDDAGSDQDGNTSKADSLILDSPSSSQQEQGIGNELDNDNGTGSSNSSNAIKQGSGMKPPKLNLKHLSGGLPSSPSEISSSFHTPPRKRSRNELDDYGTVGRPPPAPKLISPEQARQYFSSSESPSVLRSLQLRRMDGSSSYKRSSNE